MKQLYLKINLLVLLLLTSINLSAQLSGVITDSLTNEPLMYISVYYEGKGVGAVSNVDGHYKLDKRKGWDEVTFSAIGYKTQVIKIKPDQTTLNVKMSSEDVMISEVVIKTKC